MRLIAVALALMIAAPSVKADVPPIMVPYRLTKTQHVLIRAKINGKGPFNFIVDTGAPALFIGKKAAEAAGIKAGREWTTFDRFEIEGGVVIEKAKGRVDDLFQLEGMNGLGLAGAELHGVIGYNVLARYRIEYDFTRPKLAWTKLDFQPPSVGSAGGRSAPAGLEMIGGMMKFLGGMMGVQVNLAVRPRGFLGAEIGDGAVVRSVLKDSPADKAGLKAGDVVKSIGDDEIESAKAFRDKLAMRSEGEKITLTIRRDGSERQITIELGKGL
ncbi:MAG TPA: PDZ domain-containing protein [Gemmataceae bacterium]|jgi:membrane-associated protease RseP (regulator of RpoE activity)|nr:PDZ domain-containing protein [Gemmataceae bacterium]